MKCAIDTARRTACAAAALLPLVAVLPAPAQAQAFPSRPVTIVVPFPPGGGADTLARILGAHLTKVWKTQVIVDNRPGASGHIGANFVARAPADGYTLMMSSTASLDKKNVGQFAPISLVSASAYVVVVNPRLGINSIKELVARAKAEPGKLTFGSSGIGAASHLSVELFKEVAGIEMMHVPYKGTGQAVTDLLGGTLSLMFAPAQTVMGYVDTGRLKALAVTSAERSKALPNLPTVAEAGVPGYAAVGWFGLLAPVGTPAAVVDKLNKDVNAALREPEIVKQMMEHGAEPSLTTPAEFGTFIRAELEQWTRLIDKLGIVVGG
ncbi:tripartite tricarboxylate transporter substrate binding protein [Pigmentiphaga sp. YJ18]|uniref:tripartite tricarboxylate transporter substrate binding protein n=1 Tax=Pigmentiphaga sp. YJ18 TaxID=3134907 RepID=UPI003113FC1C